MFNYEERFYVEKEVAVSAQKAWEISALPGGLKRWHPFMEKLAAESWNGVGATDHLAYYSGFEFDREAVKWIEGTGYDLKVTENGRRENTAIRRITPIDGQRCKLRINGRVAFIRKLLFLSAGRCLNSK